MEQISTESAFASEISSLIENLDIECIDAVVLWCEKNNVEVETAGGWIKKNALMRSKIQAEAENLNFLKKISRLPI